MRLLVAFLPPGFGTGAPLSASQQKSAAPAAFQQPCFVGDPTRTRTYRSAPKSSNQTASKKSEAAVKNLVFALFPKFNSALMRRARLPFRRRRPACRRRCCLGCLCIDSEVEEGANANGGWGKRRTPVWASFAGAGNKCCAATWARARASGVARKTRLVS